MGLREKYSASPAASVTTLTTFTDSMSATVRRGRDTVAIATPGSSKADTTASMPAGSSIGSSPWTFTTMVESGRSAAASASRSVPEAWRGEVITASPPNAAHRVGDAAILGGDQHAVD